MSERRRDDDDVFAERLGRVLRAPEHFGDEFERSLAAAIHADRPLRRKLVPRTRRWTPRWWATPATVHVSPLAGLAIAAGMAAIVALGTLRAASPTIRPSMAAAEPVHDTVTFVRFVFVGPAKNVALVGDFNSWGGRTIALSKTSSGAWTASIPLSKGRYEYAFIVDGKQWVPDPLAPTSSDDFETKSSVIMVGT